MILLNQYVQSKQAQITLDVSMLAICRQLAAISGVTFTAAGPAQEKRFSKNEDVLFYVAVMVEYLTLN